MELQTPNTDLTLDFQTCPECGALIDDPEVNLHSPDCSLAPQFTQDELRAQLRSIERAETDLLTTKLKEFTREAWPIIEPGRKFVNNWHIDAICDHLEAVDAGEIKRLVINIPPRHLKSITVEVMFPSWVWTHRAFVKFLSVSYARALVIRDANKSRRLVQSAWYQARWPHVQIHADQNAKSYYENTQSGYRIIASIEGGTTGEGGDIILVDDPTELKDAANQGALELVRDVWDNTLTNRLNDPVNGAFVIIMQRLAENDLTGHVLKEGGWTHLYLPTEYESRRKCVTFLPKDLDLDGRPLRDARPFFSDPRTIDGELLFPERVPATQVAMLRSKGELIFNSQQQQRPVPKGGFIFKDDWFQTYFVLPPDYDKYGDGCISLDCSFKDVETSSRVAIGAWVRLRAQVYLLYAQAKHMGFPETVAIFRSFCNMFPWIGPKLIEDKANGTAIIQMLQREIPGIIPITPEGGKDSRAQAISYLFQAGNIFFPDADKAPWVKDVKLELVTYPRGEYNDLVDMTSQALNWYEKRRSGEVSVEEMLAAGDGAPMDAGVEVY